MAENQGVNGDIWNDKALQLLQLLGWDHLGDTNMDLPGDDGKEYGVDALITAHTPRMKVLQCAVLESKRYSIGSLKQGTLQKWVNRLRQKLDAFYQSQKLTEDFPSLEECCPMNLGIIMCWVHDAPNEEYFDKTFESFLSNTVINTAATHGSFKRIYVLSNPRILRLCAVAEKIQASKYFYRFIYPSQLLGDRPLVKSKVLTIEYAMSDFILAERTIKEESQLVVFFLGNLSSLGFKCLYEALIMYNLLEQGKKTIIYYYGSDTVNRIALAEGRRRFKEIDSEFRALNMFNFNTEPALLNNKNNDDDE